MTKRSIKSLHKKFLDGHDHWSINEAGTILSGNFPTRDHILGLMFLSKMIIVAHLAGAEPVATLSKQSVKIRITSPKNKNISSSDLDLASKISDSYLSTIDRSRRR